MIAEKKDSKTTRKTPTSFYLSSDARTELDQLAERLGISKAAVLEMAIRRLNEDLYRGKR